MLLGCPGCLATQLFWLRLVGLERTPTPKMPWGLPHLRAGGALLLLLWLQSQTIWLPPALFPCREQLLDLCGQCRGGLRACSDSSSSSSAMAHGELDEESLNELYTWVDTIPLSRPKRNIARDFSDGGAGGEREGGPVPLALEGCLCAEHLGAFTEVADMTEVYAIRPGAEKAGGGQFSTSLNIGSWKWSNDAAWRRSRAGRSGDQVSFAPCKIWPKTAWKGE